MNIIAQIAANALGLLEPGSGDDQIFFVRAAMALTSGAYVGLRRVQGLWVS